MSKTLKLSSILSETKTSRNIDLLIKINNKLYFFNELETLNSLSLLYVRGKVNGKSQKDYLIKLKRNKLFKRKFEKNDFSFIAYISEQYF